MSRTQQQPAETGAGRDEHAPAPADSGQPRVLHVTCPDGHRLEAPCILNGQDVVCPYCGIRFLFRYEDSDEFQQDSGPHPSASRRRRRRRAALAWTVLGVAALVVLGAAWFLSA